MSARVAIGLGGLLLAAAVVFWVLVRPPGDRAAPEPAAQIETTTPQETTAEDAATSSGADALGAAAAPRTAAAARPARAQPSLWSRITSGVRDFFLPASADADGDGRLDANERAQARELIQKRREHAHSAP